MHNESSAIDLSFRYVESDYVRALRAHYASELRLRLDIPVTLVVFGVGVYLLRSADQYWLGVALIVVAAAFALLLVAAFTVIPRVAFRREPKLRDEYSLTFSPRAFTSAPSTLIRSFNGACTRGPWLMLTPT